MKPENIEDQPKEEISLMQDEEYIQPAYFIKGVEVRYEKNGWVYWCSDWDQIHTLGLVKRCGGPGTFGHVDFFVPAEAIEA